MKTLDWGQITPEGADLSINTFVYVYNHDLTSSERVDRTIRFIVGRLLYYDGHLPKSPIHKLKFDVRGQQLTNEIFDFICHEIKLKYPNPNSLEIEFIKN